MMIASLLFSNNRFQVTSGMRPAFRMGFALSNSVRMVLQSAVNSGLAFVSVLSMPSSLKAADGGGVMPFLSGFGSRKSSNRALPDDINTPPSVELLLNLYKYRIA